MSRDDATDGGASSSIEMDNLKVRYNDPLYYLILHMILNALIHYILTYALSSFPIIPTHNILKAIGAEEGDEYSFSSDDNDFGSDTGFRGTRYSSLLMVLFWAICIVFRNVDGAIDYTTVECTMADSALAVNSSDIVEEWYVHK